MKERDPITIRRHSAARSTFLLLILFLMALNGVPSMAEDLQAAYQQAASSSPLIAQARAQLDADLAGKPLARAALLPHINADASGGLNTAHVTGFGAQTISTGYHSDIFSASLTESIFNGQAFTAMKQSDSRIRASEAALAYAQQVIALEVTQAYFGVLQAQANQRVAQQQMDLLQSIDKQTRASLQVGSGDIITVQEVQAQLDNARADLITANNAVTVAKNQLERLTHQPVEALQDITTLQPTGPQPDTIDPWLASALKNQPLLQQAQATLKVSEQQVQYAKRARWPTLTLSGIGQHAAGMLVPTVAIDQIGASLNLSIPIYEGGSTRAGIHQAEALSKANRANVANIQDQIKLETQTAFQDLEDSVAQFQATQQSVTSAKVSMDGTRKGYEIGSRSIIDLLTATTNYAAAQRNYYLALYTQLVARTQLKAAAGVLTPADIEAINTLLDSSPSK
jgi:outer membrane protein